VLSETSKGNSWGLGINGVIGGEWFVHTNVGILAEYSPYIRYIFLHSEISSEIGYETRDIHQFNFDNMVKFGVSVYF